MALIKCSECGKEISDKATTCPNCGCPIDKNGKIECEECGALIDGNETYCKVCGCPTSAMKTENDIPNDITLIKCSNCGKEFLNKDDNCIYCGFPVNATKENNNEHFKNHNNKTNNLKPILIIVGVVVFIIVLFIFINIISSGSKTYYCESEEHELRGKTCVIIEKEIADYLYRCRDGSLVKKSYYCKGYDVGKIEWSCQTGKLEGQLCIIEKTYDALEK